MASITTYFRLEPDPLRPDVTVGATAPVHDPLWLLARQWQLGEFAAQDGGTPVVARWRGVAAEPTRFVAGPIPPNTQLQAPGFAALAAPLETLIERAGSPLPSSADTLAGLRLGVDTGRLFLRLLAAQTVSRDYAPALLRAFAVPGYGDDELADLDAATTGYARLHGGRSLDGRRLRGELAGRPQPRIDETVAPGDVAELRAACADWLRLVADLFDDVDPAAECWQPARFEHTASMAARLGTSPFDETTLTAHRYDSDVLDWYEFDVNGEVNLGTLPAEAGPAVVRTVMPAPVTAPGLPARRFWEFEDGNLNLAALQPAETDLAQVLLIETLSGYGNDWFVIGVDLPVGCLVRTSSLVVADTFGARTLLRPLGDPGSISARGWGVFQHAMPFDVNEPEGATIRNLLYVAPRLAAPLIGPVVEEVLLSRDEQANLGWAIEQAVESPLQTPVRLSSARPPEPPGDPDVAPDYHLAQNPPPHWIPLLPVRPGPDQQVVLARGSVLDSDGRRLVHSVTELLGGGPDGALLIPEEEVPTGGVLVQRSYQAARWIDGTLHVWAAHRTKVNPSVPPSGVRYDYLIE